MEVWRLRVVGVEAAHTPTLSEDGKVSVFPTTHFPHADSTSSSTDDRSEHCFKQAITVAARRRVQ
eukprot:3939460-Rhodomonas_salina.2